MRGHPGIHSEHDPEFLLRLHDHHWREQVFQSRISLDDVRYFTSVQS
jgi:hypothetical protein